eukprot:SAG31_NODE_1843_length_7106_cov_7.400742_8_plen_114_part_01
MSMTEFFETWGFDISMSHTGFTGFHKIDPTTNELIQIPFFHNPRRHCWNMISIAAFAGRQHRTGTASPASQGASSPASLSCTVSECIRVGTRSPVPQLPSRVSLTLLNDPLSLL